MRRRLGVKPALQRKGSSDFSAAARSSANLASAVLPASAGVSQSRAGGERGVRQIGPLVALGAAQELHAVAPLLSALVHGRRLMPASATPSRQRSRGFVSASTGCGCSASVIAPRRRACAPRRLRLARIERDLVARVDVARRIAPRCRQARSARPAGCGSAWRCRRFRRRRETARARAATPDRRWRRGRWPAGSCRRRRGSWRCGRDRRARGSTGIASGRSDERCSRYRPGPALLPVASVRRPVREAVDAEPRQRRVALTHLPPCAARPRRARERSRRSSSSRCAQIDVVAAEPALGEHERRCRRPRAPRRAPRHRPPCARAAAAAAAPQRAAFLGDAAVRRRARRVRAAARAPRCSAASAADRGRRASPDRRRPIARDRARRHDRSAARISGRAKGSSEPVCGSSHSR